VWQGKDLVAACEEISFDATLLRTRMLIAHEERSFDLLRSLRVTILVGWLVNNNTPHPPVSGNDVILKGIESRFSKRCEKKGVRGEKIIVRAGSMVVVAGTSTLPRATLR
jgi:hypothetical protein